ncbi:MAG: hypothetical protein COY73_01055 [Candidatus Nealsonbacteria bacterium CG_4_10_14_0_8_um_filter_37_14]|uniref:GtrA/DPMS transmembrane domain-containing protein n=1 Tax=Candidatus Nealsonbacteria bacterium CG_4_10_14_0_8_um_filter_37_14 TaxID=1974684 RepID=A0A2M7R808_9BACT|nr:MAG: hypothetical protein COY73_01055 [Candidatus Nealsonbacteria bacterium CG_4_10_14_0_8_um_filter_37_14]
MKFSKRNLIYSLILGEASSWFLIFVIKNPYVAEFKKLVFLEDVVWWLPVIFPIIFLAGILLAEILAKTIKIIYQIVRFAEVGVLNTFIDFGILNLLIWLTGITGGLAIAPLNAISFLVACTNSYFWNKFWTFEKEGTVTRKEFTQFLVISGIGIGINTGIVVAGTSLISPLLGFSSGAWANLIKVLATAVSMIWNFLGYKFIVFKK